MFDQYSANLANGREGGDLSQCRCEAIRGCYIGGVKPCEQYCDPAGSCNPNTRECSVGGDDGGAPPAALLPPHEDTPYCVSVKLHTLA